MYDPEHRYLLCDLHDGGRLHPLTDETGATGPSLSPDGQWFYYLVNQTVMGGPGRLTLKRRRLDGTQPETIVAIVGKIPGTPWYPSNIYPLSTISPDGQRLATACYLGDGRHGACPWGLLVFDIPSATVNLVLWGHSWCNLHPQYSRSPHHPHDLLVQENHGNAVPANGKFTRLAGGLGADIHVIRDDGMDFRDLPWGRDGDEKCQGHQCWRGRSSWAITANYRASAKECQLIEGAPLPAFDHQGAASPGARQNDLSREFPGKPAFYHFATDIAGRRVVTDCGPSGAAEGSVWIAELGEPGVAAARDWVFLLRPRSTMGKESHLHPCLSPDGRTAFFNSDESGLLQAYAITGLSEPTGTPAGEH